MLTEVWVWAVPPGSFCSAQVNASDQETDKPSAFIKVLTLADDQLIKDIWL